MCRIFGFFFPILYLPCRIWLSQKHSDRPSSCLTLAGESCWLGQHLAVLARGGEFRLKFHLDCKVLGCGHTLLSASGQWGWGMNSSLAASFLGTFRGQVIALMWMLTSLYSSIWNSHLGRSSPDCNVFYIFQCGIVGFLGKTSQKKAGLSFNKSPTWTKLYSPTQHHLQANVEKCIWWLWS